MKKIALMLVTSLLVATTAQAQSKEMNTAKNYFDQYVGYEKAEKKTESLVKAKTAIDAAFENIKSKEGTDNQVKESVLGKAYFYKAIVYSEMANTPNAEFAKGAAPIALDAVENALKLDAKGLNLVDNLRCLEVLRAVLYNEGIAAFNGKDHAAALSSFENVLRVGALANKTTKSTEIDTATVIMVAYSAQNAGNTDKAIEYYQQGVDAKFKDESIYQNLSNIYMAKGDAAKANQVITVGKEVFPNSNAFLIGEINYLLKENKQQEAIGKMEDAARLYPDNASLLCVLGNTYESFKTDEMDKKAEASYKKALELDPKYFDALYNLAAMYFNKGADKLKVANELPLNQQAKFDAMKKEAEALFKQALPYFDRALAINPKDLGTLTALNGIYATTGDIAKATEYKKQLEAAKAGK